jgi:hypothetical protein
MEQPSPLVELPIWNRIRNINSSSSWDLKLLWILKGFKALGKILETLQDYDLPFNTTVILDHHTCIEKIQVSLHWSLGALRKKKRVDILMVLMTLLGRMTFIRQQGCYTGNTIVRVLLCHLASPMSWGIPWTWYANLSEFLWLRVTRICSQSVVESSRMT